MTARVATLLAFAAILAGSIGLPAADRWSPMASGTTNNLTGIWGSSPQDVFAVGPKGTILHYDGRTWSPMAANTQAAPGKPNFLTRVWGSGPNAVYALGFAGALLR